ncbi:MAG: bifunctional phosphopantothenoylcysteine decarboxylase/phosphopantothenate--cysteine ligase CoaBC [Acidobacteriota bacterium]|nr:bifunctional phosphopantothenoylcysteine decarboxylase/phosphopantothenate--cysteine ligase CoaBC [Thermoanaerobaculaceae bacterium]
MIKITLGVSSSISVYKALDIARRFKERDCDVRVIMTKNAAKLVSPLLFETLTGNPVAVDMYESRQSQKVEHIELAKWEDILVIAPATANIIGKMANGIADDFLSTHYLASTSKVVVAPAMNGRMYRNRIVQENIEKLKERGVIFINPKKGMLACGEEDEGALEEPLKIVETTLSLLKEKDLAGKSVVVTAGATREYIDPVRFISNPSSGKMGYLIAEEAEKRGAKVVLISGQTYLNPPKGVEFVKVETTSEMKKEVLNHFKKCDILFMAAAPSDFQPTSRAKEKIKRERGSLKIELKPTEDIVSTAAKNKKKNQIICAFAAETENHIQNAKKKIKAKGVDYIAMNDVSKKDSGFESDINEIILIDSKLNSYNLGKDSKQNLARKLLDKILKK